MADPDQPPPDGITRSSDFCWDTAVFKVEETIFRVNRHGFIDSSPLFQTMFLLPSADGDHTEEGRTENNPIVLEGYTAIDFDALLRVMYPSSRDFLSGGVTMSKDQWIGVLKLSTIWEMKEIRAFAIKMLSDQSPALTPVERVALARDHKVSTWLVEGLTNLTLDREISPDDLEQAIGLRSAFRISTIRHNLCPGGKARPLRLPSGYRTGLAIEDLCHSCCWKPSIKDKNRMCHSCSKSVATNVVGSVYIASTPEFRSSENHTYIQFGRDQLLCALCNGPFIKRWQGKTCQNCNGDPSRSWTFVFFGFYSESIPTANSLVRQVFEDEIKEYESWCT